MHALTDSLARQIAEAAIRATLTAEAVADAEQRSPGVASLRYVRAEAQQAQRALSALVNEARAGA